jgi:hypothetical protein
MGVSGVRAPCSANGSAPHGHDDAGVEAREVGRQFREPFRAVLAEAIFNDDVSSLDIAKLAQTLLEAR